MRSLYVLTSYSECFGSVKLRSSDSVKKARSKHLHKVTEVVSTCIGLPVMMEVVVRDRTKGTALTIPIRDMLFLFAVPMLESKWGQSIVASHQSSRTEQTLVGHLVLSAPVLLSPSLSPVSQPQSRPHHSKSSGVQSAPICE